MNLSRKEFFRGSLFSLGQALFDAREILRAPPPPPAIVPSPDAPPPEAPVADPGSVALADNGHCLAKFCGCFTCVERCQAQAIGVLPGEGIRIDPELCTGCGTCHFFCPITPKGVVLRPRGKIVATDHIAALTIQGGESLCRS